MQYLRALCPKLPRPPEPPVFDNATCGLAPLASCCTSPTSQHVSLPSAEQLISIRGQVFVFLFLRQMSGRLALIFLAVKMVVFHIIVMSSVSTSLSAMMPVPSALHWNPKMVTKIPVNDGGHLIVLISVVDRCQSTTACYNVVDCFQAYTAHPASRTDIVMQNLALIVPSLKSLVFSSNNQSLSYYVVLNQISLVCRVYYKYRKQTLLQKYLDHHGCLERRHDFTKDPSRSQKHCIIMRALCLTLPTLLNNQCSTLPHAAYLYPQVAVFVKFLACFLAMLPLASEPDRFCT